VNAGQRFAFGIQLEEHAVGHFMLKGTMFGLGGGIVGAAAVASVAGILGPVAGLAIAGTGFVWARRGFARQVDRYRREANDLVDALVARALEVGRGPMSF
jgi:hypothetical protein